jgi:hypothetical protein
VVIDMAGILNPLGHVFGYSAACDDFLTTVITSRSDAVLLCKFLENHRHTLIVLLCTACRHTYKISLYGCDRTPNLDGTVPRFTFGEGVL